MDPAAPNPLLRSFERHLRAENRSDQTVATYLIALRQAETFLAATRGTTLAAAGRADLEDLLTRRAAANARYRLATRPALPWTVTFAPGLATRTPPCPGCGLGCR